tara:strand:+ start:304 stop:933 length:630 start_codon:yes stop_codon:yes gene_type:complete
MNLSNYYWYFQNAIPPRICDMILQYGAEEKEEQEQAVTGGLGVNRNIKKNPLSKKELKDLKKKRDSNVVWMSDRWIYKEIQPYIGLANKNAGWNFEWDFTEPCQFTIYKKGQYYDWHCDSWEKPYDSGKIRKLSMTISLTDSKKYKGGELEFDFRNRDPHQKRNLKVCTEILPQGSVVVFPSFIWHRVKPVTKGVRYSLVCWNLGYPFK